MKTRVWAASFHLPWIRTSRVRKPATTTRWASSPRQQPPIPFEPDLGRTRQLPQPPDRAPRRSEWPPCALGLGEGRLGSPTAPRTSLRARLSDSARIALRRGHRDPIGCLSQPLEPVRSQPLRAVSRLRRGPTRGARAGDAALGGQAANCLRPVICSPGDQWSGRRGSNPRPSAWEADADCVPPSATRFEVDNSVCWI